MTERRDGTDIIKPDTAKAETKLPNSPSAVEITIAAIRNLPGYTGELSKEQLTRRIEFSQIPDSHSAPFRARLRGHTQ